MAGYGDFTGMAAERIARGRRGRERGRSWGKALIAPSGERSGERTYVWRLVGLFCAGWAVLYADRTALYPLLSVIARDLGLSGARTGWITGTYFFFYVATLAVSGLLAERFGLKRILVASSLLSAIGILGFGMARDYASILLVAALHGGGAGPYYAMAYSLTIYTVPAGLRGAASGAINGGMSLGLAAGLAMAGPIYHLTASWRAPFLLLSVPTFLAVVLYQVLVRDVRAERPRSIPLSALAMDPTLVCMNLSGFCVLYGWWVVLSWGPVFFQTERGVGLTVSGFYTLVIAITAIPSGLLLGHLSDRTGRKRIVLAMLPLMALALAAIPQVRSQTGMLLALLAYGVVGKLAWDPLGIAWLGDYVSRRRPEAVGAAVSLFSFVGVSSAIVGPPLTGWIKDLTGSLAGGFYVAAAVALIGFGLSLYPADSRGARKP